MSGATEVAERTFALTGLLFLCGPLLVLVMKRCRRGRRVGAARAQRLWLRLVTLLALTALLLATAWMGELAFLAVTLALAAAAAFELWRLLESAGLRADRTGGTFVALGVIAAAWLVGPGGAVFALTAGSVLLAVVALRPAHRDGLPARLAGTLLGVMLAGGLFAFLPLLRAGDGGFGHIVFLWVVVQFHDVTSLLAGLSLGRRPLAPVLSPGKTVGGAVAGLAGAVLGATLYRFAVPAVSLIEALGLGLLVGLASVTGGLIASGLKRAAGVKDFGAVLPGHGGVLDRFDSVLVAAPFLWAALRALGGRAT
jgi:phosphatidate cytidylyltransferase